MSSELFGLSFDYFVGPTMVWFACTLCTLHEKRQTAQTTFAFFFLDILDSYYIVQYGILQR